MFLPRNITGYHNNMGLIPEFGKPGADLDRDEGTIFPVLPGLETGLSPGEEIHHDHMGFLGKVTGRDL